MLSVLLRVLLSEDLGILIREAVQDAGASIERHLDLRAYVDNVEGASWEYRVCQGTCLQQEEPNVKMG